MRPGFTISSIGHALVLGWGLVTFVPKPLDAPRTEAMPIDLVPLDELTRMRAGARNAEVREEPKQKAEKQAEPKPVRETEAKPVEQPKTVALPPPPPPAPIDPELLRKEAKAEPKPEPEPAPAPTPTPPRRPAIKPKATETAKGYTPKQRNFDPDRIAALLDKREPQRERASAESLAPSPSFGTSFGNAARLTQNELDALRAQIQACWNPPIGAENARDLIVRVRVQFHPDGSLSREPELLNRGASPYFQVAAESAMRAVRRCQPYTMPAHKYDIWKDVEVTFDPRDMFGGG